MSETKQSRYAYWKLHNESWLSSGLTQADYCTREGIKLAAFSQWRGRLKQANDNQDMRFIKLDKPQVNHSELKAPAVQFMLPNGIRVGLSCSANKEVLQHILTFIKSL